jgi:hypothetical protein
LPALAEAGIIVCELQDAVKKERDPLEQRFERELFPILSPLAVGIAASSASPPK